MERMVIILENRSSINRIFLAFSISGHLSRIRPDSKKLKVDWKKDTIEKQLIEKSLKKTAGNKSEASWELGISQVTLYNKMKKYQLPK